MSEAPTICRVARRRAMLSQRALAARAGVSPSTVARIERGRMEPTLELLTRLAAACGLDLRLGLVETREPRRSRHSPLVVEERLRENDRLSILWAAGMNARLEARRAARG